MTDKERKSKYPVKCPICGNYAFDEEDDDTMCEFCGWINDSVCNYSHDIHGPLHMSFNEAKKAWAEGRPIK